jgi:DNA-binding transcriptional regulator YiaG
MPFAEKIKFVRAELLVSQTELAKMIGVSFSTVNRWESGKLKPTFLSEKKFEKFCSKNKITFSCNDKKF